MSALKITLFLVCPMNRNGAKRVLWEVSDKRASTYHPYIESSQNWCTEVEWAEIGCWCNAEWLQLNALETCNGKEQYTLFDTQRVELMLTMNILHFKINSDCIKLVVKPKKIAVMTSLHPIFSRVYLNNTLLNVSDCIV